MAFTFKHICVICNKEFETVSNNRFTCSPNCKAMQRKKVRKLWYRKNAKRIYLKYLPYVKKHMIGRQIALRLIKKLGIKKICSICNSDYVVDIHHKDKNTSNNNLENLQILCRLCHVRVHKNPLQ